MIMKRQCSLYLFVLMLTCLVSQQVFANLKFNSDKLASYLVKQDIYFKDGLYAGDIVDTTLKYPTSLIDELETEKSIFVAHVFNQQQFWIAKIDKLSVKNVIYQMALFDGLFGIKLAHAQLRFQLSTPAQLYRVKNNKIVTTATSDLIFTIQAATPMNQEYNLVDAVVGNYLVISRLVNTYDRVAREEIPDGDIVHQYMLSNLTVKDKFNLLLNSLKVSTVNFAHQTYYATTANCINLLMDIIDETLGFQFPRIELTVENTILNGPSPNEKIILQALRERRLIHANSRLSDYNP